MNAYKTVLTVNESRQLIIQLPDNFTGSEVEIIVLNVSDNEILPSTKPNSNLRNRIQSPMKTEEIDAQMNKIRSEWQDNFS